MLRVTLAAVCAYQVSYAHALKDGSKTRMSILSICCQRLEKPTHPLLDLQSHQASSWNQEL